MSQVYHLVDRCPHCGSWLVQRTTEQNGKIHMQCVDLAQQLDWPVGSGNYLEPEDWKRLLTFGFMREKGRENRALPAIDGHGFDVLYRHTSRLSKQEASEFIEYVEAFMAQNEIITTEKGQSDGSRTANRTG